MEPRQGGPTRREALKSVALGGSVSLAGCWSGFSRSIPDDWTYTGESGKTILSVSMADFDFWTQLTFACLQGLVNRSHPRLYLDVETLLADRSLPWKRWYEEAYGWNFHPVTNPNDAFEPDLPIEGYVVVDTDVRQTANLAANYAATADVLPVTETFLERTRLLPDLPVRFDLRGKFRGMGRTEIYEWVYEHQWPDTGQGIVANIYLDGFRTQGIRDYVVANRGLCFELSSDPSKSDQYAVRDRFLHDLDDPGYVMGWATHGALDTEPEYVAHASRHASPVIMSQRMHNLTVHQQVTNGAAVSRPSSPSSTAVDVEDKVYVTFVISDGDALGSLHDHYFFNWHEASHDAGPIGWEIQPLLIDLAPGILDYYVQHAGEQEGFVAASGSIGYTHPGHVPLELLPELLTETRDYLERTNLRSLTVIDGARKPTAEVFDRVLGSYLHGVMSGYVDRGYDDYVLDSMAWAATELPDERGQDLAESIRTLAAGAGSLPQFIPVHLPITAMRARDAEAASRALSDDADIEVVSPDEFFLALHRHLESRSELAFEFNEATSPSPSGERKLAFAVDTIEFVDGAGDRTALYDVGTGLDLPMDGHYFAETANDRTFRWFGTETAEAVFLFPPEVVSASEELRVTGRPVSDTISAELTLDGTTLDWVAFSVGWREYRFQLD